VRFEIKPANPDVPYKPMPFFRLWQVPFEGIRAQHRQQCPFCASWIRREAIVCPRCQHDLETEAE